jgi:hypothetical protein
MRVRFQFDTVCVCARASARENMICLAGTCECVENSDEATLGEVVHTTLGEVVHTSCTRSARLRTRVDRSVHRQEKKHSRCSRGG